MLKERSFGSELLHPIDVYRVHVRVFEAYCQEGEVLQDVRELPSLILEQLLERPNNEGKRVMWHIRLRDASMRLLEAGGHGPMRKGVLFAQCLVRSAQNNV